MTIKELEKAILDARDAYYNGETKISDAEYDSLEDQLLKLDPTNKILSDIGEDHLDGFPKAKHTILMGSQSKCNSIDQIEKRLAAFSGPTMFICEYKLDGISLEINYVNGKFKSGITRGNGYFGDDITSNVKKMGGVPKELSDKITCSVRGEILLFRDTKDKYYSDKKNCRNAASGIAKRLDGIGCEHLNIICYDVKSEEKDFNTEMDKVKWLKENGFSIPRMVPYMAHCESSDGIKKAAKEMFALMYQFHNEEKNYDIDGTVVKSNIIDQEDIKTNLRPKTQWAIKKPQEIVPTIIRDIEWSMTNGSLIPVAVYDTVSIEGADCNRATLNNPRYIENLKIEIGDTVGIIRANQVIPRIVTNISKATKLDFIA